MLDLLKDPIALAAAGGIVAALIPWGKLGALKGLLPSFAAPAVDDDVADLAAVKRLQARFERLNCPEGKAAVKTCLAHFFEHA
jgi:hypothetical protein